MSLSEVLLRTVVVFMVLYTISRILGKKLISQMTFFDFVAGITIGSLSANQMLSNNVPILYGLIALGLFASFALILEFTSLFSFQARKIINSEPTLIIKDGKILEDALRKIRLTYDNLLMLLRKKDVFYVDEVEIAFFETDGSISVLKKSTLNPVTKKDLNVMTPSRGLAQTIILDGQLLENSLQSIGKDEAWVKTMLQTNGVESVEEVNLAQVDQQDQIFIDKKQKWVH